MTKLFAPVAAGFPRGYGVSANRRFCRYSARGAMHRHYKGDLQPRFLQPHGGPCGFEPKSPFGASVRRLLRCRESSNLTQPPASAIVNLRGGAAWQLVVL